MTLPPGDPRHGTNGYGNFKCRCDICRTAHSERQRAYREANPEKIREAKRREYEKHREKYIKRAEGFAAANPQKVRVYKQRWAGAHSHYHRQLLYNLDEGRFAELWNKRGGLCNNPGCPNVLELTRSGCHVDHDRTHCPGRKSCGTCVRGLLCHGCNTALGLAGESADRLRGLVEYLELPRPFSADGTQLRLGEAS